MIPEVVETQFADLRVPCSHDGMTVHAAIVPLCAALKLDARAETRLLARDTDLGPLIKSMPPSSLIAGPALPIGGLALWLARLDHHHHDTQLRHRVAVLQQEGFATLLDQWLPLLDSAATPQDAETMKRQFRRAQTQITTMDEVLKGENSDIECEILRVQLSQLCSFPVRPRSKQSPMLEEFWRLLFARMTTGSEINHARRSDRFLALNFRHLTGVLENTSDRVVLSPELRAELRKSRHPNFLGVRVVNSRIEHKSLRCWVFNLH
jgi:hypothetical protein